MSKLQGILKQKWLITLAGVTALCLFIWYIGPLLAIAGYTPLESESNRLISIAVIILIWVIAQIFSFWQAKKKNDEVMAGMVATPQLSATELASKEELETLTQHMGEALSELKTTRLGGKKGKQYLYQLPWYVIIGPPGAGKTTLLRNSKLKFPLAKRFGDEAIRGVGGTRNCDWWFAEEAVILDTAGRYTTQDSQEEVDKSAWLGFLNLLKKNRGRRPINGVIIAVSLSELLESDEAQRKIHANAIRKRIHELHENLGISFPIYFLLTKMDLLGGFSDFFGNLDQVNRNQVWGTTFPLSEDPNTNSIQTLESELELLERRLQDQLINKLEGERSEQKRENMYLFPQQFSSLKNIILSFTNEVFQPTRYQHTSMIRGVYFTSATQEGTPIDRIMGAMANSFGIGAKELSGTSGRGKSFFINKLLTDIVFPESGLAATNLKLERKQAWLQHSSAIAIIGIFCLCGLIFALSYFKNLAYIEKIDQDATDLINQIESNNLSQNSILNPLPVLNRVRDISSSSSKKENRTPWTMTFGLYQGDKLGKAGDIVYSRLLNQAFLPQLLSRMERQMSQSRNNKEFLFEALKTYLMFESNERYDPETIHAWFAFDWSQQNNLPDLTTNEQRSDLMDHLDALLKNRPKTLYRPLNQNLIASTRSILSSTSLSDRIYASLKQEALKSDSSQFSLRESGGQNAPLVFTRISGSQLNEGIPKLFTYNGYHKTFKNLRDSFSSKIAEESWILGDNQVSPSGEELNQLKSEIELKYADEFILHWQSFLSDIQIVQFIDLQHTVKTLGLLSDSESPLKQLLLSAARETQLDRPDTPEVNTEDPDSLLSKTKFSGIDSISLATKISEKFKTLHATALAIDGKPAPIDQTINKLNELYNFLLAVEQNGGGTLDAPQQSQARTIIGDIKNDVSRKPPIVSSLLNKVTSNVETITGKGLCASIKSAWQNEVLAFCNAAINGRYPITKGSSSDITNQDFGSLFGPGGKIDTFVKNHLASSIKKTPQRWLWNTSGNSVACASSSSLDQLKRADYIKQAFFPAGTSPSISFRIKPASMSSDIFNMNLDIDGQKISFENQAANFVSVQWPGPNNSGTINLMLNPQGHDGNSGFTKSGDWALFRLFDEGSLQKKRNSNNYNLTIRSGAREIFFELQAGSAISPFDLNKLRSFRCPSSL